jgi:uncharacterized protein
MGQARSTDVEMVHRTRAIDWPLVVFFVLAYVITWGLIPVLGVIAGQSGLSDWRSVHRMGEAFDFDGATLSVPGWIVYLITRIQDFSFSIAGVVVVAVVGGRAGLAGLGRRLVRWRIRWYWYLLGLLPFGWYLVATALAGALPSLRVDADLVRTSLFSIESGFLVFLLLRGAMGEELGLRGFALPRLQTSMSPLKASVIIGMLWGAWHLPVLLGRSSVQIVAFILATLALSCIATWLFNGAAGSLIPVLIFHAAQNFSGGASTFESFFPALQGSEWELTALMLLVAVGVAAGASLARRHRLDAT